MHMNLSSETFTVLKNFGSINRYLLIEPGRTLQTSMAAGVLARAVVKEYFPSQIIIHDLNQFLSVAGLFREPHFWFDAGFVRITGTDGGAEAFYLYGPRLITHSVPSIPPATPKRVIEFDLPEDKWSEIQKAATVLGKKEVRIVSDGEVVHIQTYDLKNPSANTYIMPVQAQPDGVSCEHTLSLASINLVKGSYRVTVSAHFTTFTNISGYDLKYWVACDHTSTFNSRATAA